MKKRPVPAATLSSEDQEDRDSPSVQEGSSRNKGPRLISVAISLADFLGAAALFLRATVQSVDSGQEGFLIPRLAAAGLLGAWSLILLGHALRPASAVLARIVRAANSRAVLILVPWSALATALDLLAGAGPVVLVGGLVAASLYGWDRPLRTAGAGVAACLACAGVSAAPAILGQGPLDLESLAIILITLSLAVGIPFTIGFYVNPSRDQLRTLEMENRQLWDLSFRDPLTGLYNRRYAQEAGRSLFQRARRYREEFHVLMIDVDRFKRVNDELSHSRGDEVLKAIAAIIQSCLRSSDAVSRYGGEEFLVYLVQSNSQVAQFVADRIREAIESTSFAGVPWTVTISVGVAGMKDDDSLESLIDRSDRFVYSSKRGGRNRVSGF